MSLHMVPAIYSVVQTVFCMAFTGWLIGPKERIGDPEVGNSKEFTKKLIGVYLHIPTYGSFQKSRALIQTPNRRALTTRTPTTRTPNL